MSDALIRYETEHGEVKLSASMVKRFLVSGNPNNVSFEEVTHFLQLCKYQKLNPWLREAYLIKYGDRDPATIVTGKDVFIKRAAKNRDFNGTESGVVVKNAQGGLEYRPGGLVLPEDELVGGWASVYRKSWDHPVKAVVALAEYLQTKRDGTPNRQWARMPATMIIKVAKSQALREAFPEDFMGLYDESEIDHGDVELPRDPIDADNLPDDPPETSTRTENASAEDAEIVEDPEDEPQEAPKAEPQADPLAKLKKDLEGLLGQAAKINLFSDEQLQSFGQQVSSMRSEAALNAMHKNISGQLERAKTEKDETGDLF